MDDRRRKDDFFDMRYYCKCVNELQQHKNDNKQEISVKSFFIKKEYQMNLIVQRMNIYNQLKVIQWIKYIKAQWGKRRYFVKYYWVELNEIFMLYDKAYYFY